MNAAHLHLMLNHVPTIGLVVGVGLYLLSLVRREDPLERVSHELFFVIAVLALPTYVTGLGAHLAIADRADVATGAIDAHHGAALLALACMEMTGFTAWLALWRRRRNARSGWGMPVAVLALALMTLVVLTGAATLGGEIRHPELRTGEAAASPGPVAVSSIGAFVGGHPWVWPAAEALHFVGLSLLFGVMAVINLRLLGVMKAVSFQALHRLLPWGALGFGINVVTGMLFLASAGEQYVESAPFYWKVALLTVGGASLLYLTVGKRLWILEGGDDAPVLDRAIGAGTIALWVGVMYLGRMLPFLGSSF